MTDTIPLREYIEKVIELKFESSEQALRLATRELERRLEGMNEVRAQLAAQKVDFVSRELFDGITGKLQDGLNDVKGFQNKTLGYVLGAAAAASVVTIVVDLILRSPLFK